MTECGLEDLQNGEVHMKGSGLTWVEGMANTELRVQNRTNNNKPGKGNNR